MHAHKHGVIRKESSGICSFFFFPSHFLRRLYSWHLEHKDTHSDLLVPMAFWFGNPRGREKQTDSVDITTRKCPAG